MFEGGTEGLLPTNRSIAASSIKLVLWHKPSPDEMQDGE
jgi:hypothetical protein